MYCEPCRVERLGTARFCVICGSKLYERPAAEVEADLERVRWLLAELSQWDTTSIGPRSRVYVQQRYLQREKVLLAALGRAAPVRAGAIGPATAPGIAPSTAAASSAAPAAVGAARAAPSTELTAIGAEPAAVGAEPVASSTAPAAVGAGRAASSTGPAAPSAEPSGGPRFRRVKPATAPAALLEAEPDAPSVEDRVVAEASSWSRIWKPFLNESIGWFIGAFLILSGTFYLVSDSWSDMTSTLRALVVFGLAAGWTLGFSAWAQFLWRRETTRGAARVLKLIGAAMAPLAPFAVGPVAMESPLLAGVLVLGWCAVAAALALGVTRDLQQVGLRHVPAAMAVCAAMMGLAPWVVPLHGAALWLNAIPVGLLWLNSRSAVRTQGGTARLFAFLAPLYLAVIFGARLHYALISDNLAWGTWAPFLALALTAALELRSPVGPDGRPRWERAADPTSVLVVAGQLGLMAWAVLGAAPAFFVTSAIGAHTCWRLLKGSSSPLAPRWIYGLYFFTYFAWQTCGQLVPGVLTQLLADLKAALGYAPAGALPFAYNAVYAAAFVIAGAALALKWLQGPRRTWAEPLLRCTWITALLTVALAVSSLGTDTRPAMISVPLLMALTLFLGLWLDRPAFTRAGAGITVAFAATLVVWATPEASALSVALVALLLAALSIPFTALHRAPLSSAGVTLAAVSAGLAWILPGSASHVVALAVAFAAAWLIARNEDQPFLQQAAWLIPGVLVARALVLWAPEYAALGLAIAAVALAILSRQRGRLRHVEPASAVAALLAPLWQLGLQQGSSAAPVLLGAVLVLCALALALGVHRAPGVTPTSGWRDALALGFGAAALLPLRDELQMWPQWTPIAAAVGYALLGLTASVWAARTGRRWRPALLAALTVAGATATELSAELLRSSASPQWVAAIAALAVLATVRALLPSISVPLAALLAIRATDADPTVLLALAAALSVLALFEEWDVTWQHVLGKAAVAWAASLSALGLLAILSVLHVVKNEGLGQQHWLVAACLPLLWIRATRSGVLAFTFAPLLFLCTGGYRGWHIEPRAAWIIAGALLALTHLVGRVTPLRALLFGAEDVERLKPHFAPWALAGSAALGAGLVLEGGSGLPWALLLVLAASELLALRLATASAFALATPGLAPLATTALVAIAFLERLTSGVVSRLLGSKPHPLTVQAAAVSAILLAGFSAATALPGDAMAAAWLLGATLAAAAVLLGQRWLFTAGVLAAAVPIAISAAQPHLVSLLLPRAAWIALGAAALAAGLRSPWVQELLRKAFARLSCPVPGDLASPLWLGATAVATLACVLGADQPELAVPLLAAGTLLLFTPHQVEVAAAAMLAALLVFVVLPPPVGAAVLGGVGFALCLGGVLLEGRHRAALAWHHAGWVLSLVALTGGTSLHHPATAIAWAFAAGCAVVMAHRHPALEWVRWVGLVAGAHVGLFYLGLKLSTGAPRELILPWVATASLLLGAGAIKMAKATGRAQQRFAASWALMSLGMLELLGGVALLHGGEGREAIVALVGVGAALWALGGRIWHDDDAVSAIFAGLLVPLGFVAVRRLAFGAGPDMVETLAALVAGAGVAGVARWLAEAKLENTAQVARGYAFWWPLAGLLAAPWDAPWTLCLLLLAQSAHFAVVARTGTMKRRAALLSTLAFNGAMAAAFFAAGAHSAEYLLIPFGLSLLLLLKVFEKDLAEDTRVKLRAAAVTLVYGAAAFRPLTFETTAALWLCVTLCVVGVGLGIALRIRSYVYLGTAFMMITIVANLVRFGVREPRIGALFLSGLGLAVVGFMVLVTTKRSELVARYQRARLLLQQWEG